MLQIKIYLLFNLNLHSLQFAQVYERKKKLQIKK